MSNNSHGSPSSKPRFCSSTLTQIQIERLKREDEDEHWISGEELYTEGSSDDDEDRMTRVLTASDCISQNLGNVRISPRGLGRHKWGHSGPPRGQIAARRQVPSIPTTEKIGCIPSEIVNQDKSCSDDLLDSNMDSPVTEDQGKCGLEESVRSEISWRPKRDEDDDDDDDNDQSSIQMLEETISELRELRLGYREILDSVSELKSLNENVIFADDDSRDTNVTAAKVINELESASGLINSDCRTRIEDMSHSLFSGDGELRSSYSDTSIDKDKIKKEIFNVIRFDKWIGELDEKMQKESEVTRFEQILNRKELRRLQSLRGPESGQMAKNSIEFFELFSSSENMEIYQSPVEELSVDQEMVKFFKIDSIDTTETSKTNEVNLETLDEDKESLQTRREELEEKLELIENKKANFIKRNKELASCAIGTLAITDVEKKRLEELIQDCDEDDEQGSTITTISSSTVITTPYTIDREADELLKNLTEQLTNMNSETYRKSEEKQGELIPHKEQLVLSSLRTLAESNSQMIHPISEDEIRRLIDEYYVENDVVASSRLSIDHFPSEILGEEIQSAKRDERNVRDEHSAGSCSSMASSKSSTVTREVIEQLVKEAKTQMPFFQFKYHTGLDEETNNDKEE